jgi:cell division transport system permease protein
MSGRGKLLFAEAWRSLGANLSTTVAATMTVLIGMFLLGLFIALGTWTVSWSNHVKSELVVKINFADDATTKQKSDYARVLSQSPFVKAGGVRYVSKQQALHDMAKRYPELVKNLTSNPLPDSLQVTPNKAENVDQLYNSVSNTIRLSIFSRRREIEVMKLVGATNWFVRGPFMLEGLLCGAAGAVLAIFFLVLGKAIALPSILPHLSGDSDVHAMAFPLVALVLLGTGLALGAVGSGLTIRRFLQV